MNSLGVKNTFLDVTEHKFLHYDEPFGVDRRCQSIPREWKPSTPTNSTLGSVGEADSTGNSEVSAPRGEDSSRSSSSHLLPDAPRPTSRPAPLSMARGDDVVSLGTRTSSSSSMTMNSSRQASMSTTSRQTQVLEIGDIVMLTSDSHKFPDAARGNLTPSTVGTVIHAGPRCNIKTADGKTWFYDREALQKVRSVEADLEHINVAMREIAEGVTLSTSNAASDQPGSHGGGGVRDYSFLRNLPGQESGVSVQTQDSNSASWQVQFANRVRRARSAAADAAGKKLTSAKRAARQLIGRDVPNASFVDDEVFEIKTIRRFAFKTDGCEREVILSHHESTWFLKLDSDLVASKRHANSAWKGYSTSVDFSIPPLTGDSDREQLVATLRAEWLPRNAKWSYSLLVGDREVPACWTKTTGMILHVVPPEIDMIPIRRSEDAEDDADVVSFKTTSTSTRSSGMAGLPRGPATLEELGLDVGTPSTPSGTASEISTLDSEDRALHPAMYDARLDSLVDVARRELSSYLQVGRVSVQKQRHKKMPHLAGSTSILISAEIQAGSLSVGDVLQGTREALTAEAARLKTASLLSVRVQREEVGQSLRASVVCVPAGSEDNMCWDLFNRGYCPRQKSHCRWYHPQASDTVRIKVNIRSSEAANETRQVLRGL